MKEDEYVVDVDRPGGRTLVSRSRHNADGLKFTVDEKTDRLKTSEGLCVHTGAGTRTTHS